MYKYFFYVSPKTVPKWIINTDPYRKSYLLHLSAHIKIKKIKTITRFVIPKGMKVRANKTGINFLIFISICMDIVCNTMLYMSFQYSWELVLIQQILISLEAILKNRILPHRILREKTIHYQGWREPWQQPSRNQVGGCYIPLGWGLCDTQVVESDQSVSE